MKKIVMSAVALTAIMGSFNVVSAADKSGIDFKTTGQTVIYYNTAAKNGGGQDLFGHKATDNTRANFGIQLNFDADLGNDFTFGSQVNYLGTLGLEKNLVNNVMQSTNGTVATANIADDIYLSKLYIAKQLGNSTVKLGRQELPKSLSPFAFSEGWNVFKNTFDAMLAVNTDLPNTTLVGAYVAKSNHNGFGNNMSNFTDLSVNNNGITGAPGLAINGEAYMLTIANKSIPMTAVTASFYNVQGIAAQNRNYVEWLDAKIADKSLPIGLSMALQGGAIQADSDLAGKDTSAFGAKIGLKPMDALSLAVAYSHVNDGTVHVQNTGGVKTPLYTQMIANQGVIKTDNDTVMLKGVYNTGDYGKVILQGTQTMDNSAAAKDFTDIELVYKVKAGAVNLLAAYINQSWDAAAAPDSQNIVRVVARYNF